jgi:transcription termination/antitermination protein NusA
MNYDYTKRGFLLPKGCKDLGDVLKRKAVKQKKLAQPLYACGSSPGHEIQQPLASNEEVLSVFRKYFPALANGTVEVVAMARKPGRRCYLVVRSHDPKVSAVAACSFPRSDKRFMALHAELRREMTTIHQWCETPEQLIKGSFFDFGVEVVCDSSTKRAVVTIDKAIRKVVMRGTTDHRVAGFEEQADLVAEITGWKISLTKTGNA